VVKAYVVHFFEGAFDWKALVLAEDASLAKGEFLKKNPKLRDYNIRRVAEVTNTVFFLR
jgi:hypothetical protein